MEDLIPISANALHMAHKFAIPSSNNRGEGYGTQLIKTGDQRLKGEIFILDHCPDVFLAILACYTGVKENQVSEKTAQLFFDLYPSQRKRVNATGDGP